MNDLEMARSMVPLKTQRRSALLGHSQCDGKNTSKLNLQDVIPPPSEHYPLLAPHTVHLRVTQQEAWLGTEKSHSSQRIIWKDITEQILARWPQVRDASIGILFPTIYGYQNTLGSAVGEEVGNGGENLSEQRSRVLSHLLCAHLPFPACHPPTLPPPASLFCR